MFPPSKRDSRPTSFNRQTATPRCWHRKPHYCELSFSSMRHNPTEICYKTSTHICTLVLSQKPNPYMRFFKPNDSYSINSFSFQICRSRFVGSSQKSWLVHRATLIFSLFFINFYWHTWLTSVGSLKKQESSRKISTSAILTMSKILTVWITTNCGKFWTRWEYQTIWPASWEICMQVRKLQLEPDMEQQTGSKSGQEYVKAVYCHPAYLTYMQSI